MANKVKKVLIIGDSNCLPRIISKKISVNLEDTYIFKLKKKLKSDKVEQVVWGGLTTTQLSNFAISYYQKWKPDFIIIHSGINDVKNQFISNNSLKILYKFFSLFSRPVTTDDVTSECFVSSFKVKVKSPDLFKNVKTRARASVIRVGSPLARR